MTGAATAFCTATDNANKSKLVVSVSLDRFLRIHETTSIHRKLLNKAYLKQRLTAVLVDEDHHLEETAKKEEDEEDDDLWNNMTVTSSKRKNRSS